MKAGDRIRFDVGSPGMWSDLQDFTVEEFRHTLGIFECEDALEEATQILEACPIDTYWKECASNFIAHNKEVKS